MLIILSNGKPIYYPYPLKPKWAQCALWAIFYGAVWAALGHVVALGSMFVHLVAVPLAFIYSKKFRCSFTYFHYIQTPFLTHDNPKDFGVSGARNLYIRHQSKVDNCQVDLGLWHVLPKSVYNKNKDFVDDAAKDAINELFDEELRNTDAPIFLYCHGITQSRALQHRTELYNLLQDLDVHVIAFDYRGFADSTLVVPSKMGMVEDTMIVYSWIRNFVGNERPVFVWAHSIGTAIALKCFSKLDQYSTSLGLPLLPQPRGIVLEGSFNNIYEVLENFPFAKVFNWMPPLYTGMVRAIKRSPEVRVLPEEYVKTLTSVPLMMLHAVDDDVVPFALGTKLYGYIIKSRMNEDERPIFKIFPSGRHLYICRDQSLPAIVDDFITKYQ